jgi:hypothetical protein
VANPWYTGILTSTLRTLSSSNKPLEESVKSLNAETTTTFDDESMVKLIQESGFKDEYFNGQPSEPNETETTSGKRGAGRVLLSETPTVLRQPRAQRRKQQRPKQTEMFPMQYSAGPTTGQEESVHGGYPGFMFHSYAASSTAPGTDQQPQPQQLYMPYMYMPYQLTSSSAAPHQHQIASDKMASGASSNSSQMNLMYAPTTALHNPAYVNNHQQSMFQPSAPSANVSTYFHQMPFQFAQPTAISVSTRADDSSKITLPAAAQKRRTIDDEAPFMLIAAANSAESLYNKSADSLPRPTTFTAPVVPAATDLESVKADNARQTEEETKNIQLATPPKKPRRGVVQRRRVA